MIRNFLLFGLACITLSLHAQDIQWEKSYGGRQADYLFDVQPTADYGFILAGSSLSLKSGNKTETANGDLDYWIWKMDEHGTEDWQKSFGGSGSDFLQGIKNTRDGGFILAGTSDSPKGAGKKGDCRGGNDYWIIKLNAKGSEEWQQTYGGNGQDDLLSISQTADGGYIVGGSSSSGKNGDKTDNSRGNMDYWILKLDGNGIMEWQKSFGGEYADLLRALSPTADGGYILGGYSNSPQSKDKTSDNLGEGGDYWILKLDSRGMIEWQQTLGGDQDDQLYALQQTSDNGYIIGGNSNSGATALKSKTNRNGSDIWIVKLDEQGSVLWQETYDFGKSDMLASIVENEDHSLLMGGYTKNKEDGDDNNTNGYIAFSISEKGEELWRRTVGSDGEDILKKTITTRDGGYLLVGTSNPEAVKAVKKNVKSNSVMGLSDGGNLAGAQQLEDTMDGAVNDAASDANAYVKEHTDAVVAAANNAIGQDKDSAVKAGLNGPAGELLNPKHGTGSDSSNATANKGPKPGLRASRDKSTNYGNKDFWVVKLKDKDKKDKDRKGIEAFPNPTFQFTNVVVGFDYDKGTATVFDLSGRQLQSFKITERTIPIDLGSYPEGIYIVKIATNKGEEALKIIKGIN